MRQENPDEKKVTKLTGDIHDLQTKMEEKASVAFAGRTGYGYDPGPSYGNCDGRRGW